MNILPATKAKSIKNQYMLGEIPLAEAEKRLEPIVEEMNDIAKAVAKKHGRRIKKFSIRQILRSV